MAQITAEMVRDLRAATNVSMMECKRALAEAAGDMQQATKLLRERGMAVAAKRAAKEANQGLVAAAATRDGRTIAMVEVNCETDFVARNADFRAFVASVAEKALTTDQELADAMRDELMARISAIGENLKIRRNVRYTLSGTGRLASYIHLGGKVGVLLEAACRNEATVRAPAFEELVRDLTLQVAAASPRYVAPGEIPAEEIAGEREIYAKQVQGKPANIVAKIVDGKIQKYYTEVCLLHQPFIREQKQSITQVIEEKSRALGDSITVRRFVRYQLGT